MKKMKTLIGLIAVSFIVLSCTSQKTIKNKNDLSELKLIGKIKTFTESRFKAVDISGEIQNGNMQSKEIMLFNDKGNKIQRKFFQSRWQYR